MELREITILGFVSIYTRAPCFSRLFSLVLPPISRAAIKVSAVLGVLGFYSREPAPRAAHLAAHYLAQLPTALLWALVSTVVLPACPVRARSAGHGVAVSAVT